MKVTQFVATAAMAGGLGAGSIVGAGHAMAGPHWHPGPPPPPPGHVGHVVNVPSGQIAKWVGVPPGHWDKPWKWFN